MKKINRRSLVQAAGVFGAGAALSGVSGFKGIAQESNRSIVNVTLDVQEVAGRPAYNGLVPGPIVKANAGDSLNVRLINSLPALNDDCKDHNTFHGTNTTNLHTHGLHVSPRKDSTGMFDADNVFLKITPKDQVVPCQDNTFREHMNDYRFELPLDHPPGTHWYHAHKHGSTSSQVGAGLAGPLIVADPPGTMPSYIENAAEKIFMIMDRGVILVDTIGGGTRNPTISMRPGEVQRWRIINARVGANAFVHLGANAPELDMFQIAFDGLTLDKPYKVDPTNRKEPWLNPAALAPGNRTDIMVHVPSLAKEGEINVAAAEAPKKFLHSSGAVAFAASPAQIKIKVEGAPVDHKWTPEARLPGSGLEPITGSIDNTRSVVFGTDEFGNFAIDRLLYNGEVQQTMALGSTEEWAVSNETGGTHPFHIHVNPFFVTHIDGQELKAGNPLRRWQDTIALPGNTGSGPGLIKFRSRFIDFTGQFVIHCHILRHEDMGMMQKVEVV